MRHENSMQGDHTAMFFDNPEHLLSSLQQYILTGEEFGKLLEACAPPDEEGQRLEHATVGNQAILWLLYDTGIHALELLNLRMKDVDREQALITIHWPGTTSRRIALGRTCLHHVLDYLDHHRLGETEFAQRDNSGEDHVFLSELGHPFTMSDLSSLFAMLNNRSVLPGKCLHPSTLRDTFIIRFLELSHDAITLQYILSNVDAMMISYYMHLNKASTQSTKSRYALDEQLISAPAPSRGNRRRAFQPRE